MPIENKSTEAKQSKGFGGNQSAPPPQPDVNVSDMALAIQVSMGNEALGLVQQVFTAQEQVEDAAANAIVTNRQQMGARILDKVCSEVVEMAATDRLDAPDQYANQVGQAFMAMTQQSAWKKSTPDQLARSKSLFLTPQQMASKALPGA